MATKIDGYANRHHAEGKFPVVFNPLRYDHESAPCTIVIHGDKHERVFTESEVRELMGPLLALSSARLSSITVKGVEYMEAENVEFAFAQLKDIAVRLGLYFDPA
jgi:hypothetical protein